MQFSPGNIYHVYNEGNNRELLFHEPADYILFLRLYRKLIGIFSNTVAWTLRPGFFNFMIEADDRCAERLKQGGLLLDPITNGVRKLLSGYARYINKKYGRKGSLFRQKTKAVCLTGYKSRAGNNFAKKDRVKDVFKLIHGLPLIVGEVEQLEDWEFSSLRDYAGLRQGNLCRKDLAARHCGYSENGFLREIQDYVAEKINSRYRYDDI